jgi:hypothetical protein
MQGGFKMKWVLLLGAGVVLGGMASCSPPPRPALNLFPAAVLTELSLQDDEIPTGYELLTTSNLLARAGLSQNPDYLLRRADLEDIVQMDGAAAFLALYGTGESVRLMVKGVFFHKKRHAEKYAKVQGSRQRQVMAYRRKTTGGIWMLFIACDPGLTYKEAELRAIKQAVEKYQLRLALTPLFDQMNIDDDK